MLKFPQFPFIHDQQAAEQFHRVFQEFMVVDSDIPPVSIRQAISCFDSLCATFCRIQNPPTIKNIDDKCVVEYNTLIFSSIFGIWSFHVPFLPPWFSELYPCWENQMPQTDFESGKKRKFLTWKHF
ncbi:hypothetical protein [Akkermansia sp. 54_46]|jgi:hypothetical protein|uniref:hypothetical protein n=1 Tax=Akkermansia sp. 54_46 TaxID=1896967 RepID=UPI00257C54D9|nr:hypothetical protein [Akkermansia sp. 54_46]